MLIHKDAINDADYKVYVDGKHCKIYQRWINMLERAYCPNYHKKYPTYVGVTVCNGWLTFSNFRNWVLVNDVSGWVLDKDILGGDSKIYSPDTCVFIHPYINRALSVKPKKVGLPTGISLSKDKSKYRARINIGDKFTSIGTYNTIDEAQKAFDDVKIKHITSLVSMYENRKHIADAILIKALDIWNLGG